MRVWLVKQLRNFEYWVLLQKCHCKTNVIYSNVFYNKSDKKYLVTKMNRCILYLTGIDAMFALSMVLDSI